MLRGLGRQRRDLRQRRRAARGDGRRRLRGRRRQPLLPGPACSRRTPTSRSGWSGPSRTAAASTSTSPAAASRSYADNLDLGQQFLEWLATDGQDVLVADNHEYPANPAVEPEPLIVEAFGTDFVRDPLHADELGSLNPDAVRLMDEAGLRLSPTGRDRRSARAVAPRRHVAARPAAPGRSGGRLGRRRRRRRGRRSSPRSRCWSTSILRPNTDVWRQQWDTRLPERDRRDARAASSASSPCSIVLGVVAGVARQRLPFPGRRVLSWALVLPLAMPGYILGFVTTSVFGVAGPVQTWWRDQFGRDAWFPEIRSMPFAIAHAVAHAVPVRVPDGPRRAARPGRPAPTSWPARSAPRAAEATRRVVLPMLRPAIAAGAAVVVMETLTDFATVQYFNVETVTVGRVPDLARQLRPRRGERDRLARAACSRCSRSALERVLRGPGPLRRIGRPGRRRRADAACAAGKARGGDARGRLGRARRLRRARAAAGRRGRSTSRRGPRGTPMVDASTPSSSATASC